MSSPPNTAMIFAAGLGTRMRPLTHEMPKPLVQINGKALIDYSVDKLVEAGITKVVINTHYMADKLESHLSQRNDIEIIISYEKILLETGGGLVKALPHLGNDPFYVINSDVILIDALTTSAFSRLAERWDGATMDALLLLHPVSEAIGYRKQGDFFIMENDQLQNKEKGKSAPYVYTGIQILHPQLLMGYKEEPFSLAKLFSKATENNGSLKRMYGLVHDGKWLHIGDMDSIKSAEKYQLK